MGRALDVLQREEPAFHAGGDQQWGISIEVLQFLEERAAGATTLETGSGYSTVVMGSEAERHIAVSPDHTERSLIETFCREHDIDISRLDFRVRPSEVELPSLSEDMALDLVLIDGSHSFPLPFMDWYYTADLLRGGGLVLIDDIQLRVPRLLRSFLVLQPEWEHVSDLGKTAVFRKRIDGPVRVKLGGHQPWGLPQYPIPDDSLITRIRKWRRNGYVQWQLRGRRAR